MVAVVAQVVEALEILLAEVAAVQEPKAITEAMRIQVVVLRAAVAVLAL